MKYIGNLTEDQVIDFTFTSHDATGAPATLAGTPAISVYKANGTTQSTAGVTLVADFDGVTGLNHVRIDTSADAFYAVANDYSVVITTGTVDSVSVVGYTVACFSIENRFIEATVTSIATDAITAAAVKADAVTKIQAGLATPTNITAGTITTVTNLTNAPTVGDLTATMKASVTAAVPTVANILAGVVDGTVDLKTALQRILAVTVGDCSATEATGVETYDDSAGAPLLTQTVVDAGATTTRVTAIL